MSFKTLRPNQRLWDDIESEIRERYGLGMSLRWIKACLDARLGSSVGLRTLNQRVREMARLVTHWRGQEVDDVPPVVNLDGIWGTVMEPTWQVKQDRLGRKPEVKRGHRKPVLVAQGIWPDSGLKKVVGWVAGRAEDQESWEALLTQLYERGIVPERGLRLFVGDGSLGLKEARQTVFWGYSSATVCLSQVAQHLVRLGGAGRTGSGCGTNLQAQDHPRRGAHLAGPECCGSVEASAALLRDLGGRATRGSSHDAARL